MLDSGSGTSLLDVVLLALLPLLLARLTPLRQQFTPMYLVGSMLWELTCVLFPSSRHSSFLCFLILLLLLASYFTVSASRTRSRKRKRCSNLFQISDRDYSLLIIYSFEMICSLWNRSSFFELYYDLLRVDFRNSILN